MCNYSSRQKLFYTVKAAVQAGDLDTFSGLVNAAHEILHMKKLDFFSLVPIYCVVYNQPRMLEMMAKRKSGLTMPPISGISVSLLQFAKALGHDECCKKISKYSGLPLEDVDDSSDDHCSKLYQVPLCVLVACGDEDFCITCLRKLAARGHNVNCKGSEEASPLHEAIRLKLSCNVLETLFSLGSDVNLKHRSGGQSLLFKFLCKIKYYKSKDEITNILRLILFENPSFGTCMDQHSTAFDADLSEINKQLLVECGFRHPSVLKGLDPSPPSLKEQCRNVLRQRYPGKLIFTEVASLRLPRSIRDYILIEHLKYA